VNRLKVNLQQSILTLHQQGWSQRSIARVLAVDREAIRACLRRANPPITTPGSKESQTAEPGAAEASDLALATTAESKGAPSAKPSISTPGSKAGRPSECGPFLATITAAVEAGLSAKRIHQDLLSEHGFGASYQSVKRCVHKLLVKSALPVRRLESAPGEQTQIDFGQGAFVLTEKGRRRRPHLFRAVLSYSRKGYSEVVWRQDTESFIRCVENAFRHFGGVTRTVLIDNLKAGVLKADWFDPELNPKLREFATHYGTVVLPTRPGRPEHKGKIEAGVKYAQNNALKGRSFQSLAEHNLFLSHWETHTADTRIHGTVRTQVARLFAAERAALLPLPASYFPCFVEARRRVHRDGYIEFDKAYYSVPPEYLRREVWVRAEGRVVSVFNQRMVQIGVHVRQQPGRFATDEEHIHARKRWAVEYGADYLLGRCRLIGPHTRAWAEAVHVQHDVRSLRMLQGLLALARKHPVARLEAAAALAVHRGVWRLRDLSRLLSDEDKVVQVDFLETHPLIRDLQAYKISSFSHP
jgi:transposase